MRNGVQYGVDTADVLSTVAECDASASGGKGTTQVASAKALSELNSNLGAELSSNLEAELSSRLGGLRFGIDADGNYGYKEVGADTVIPFKGNYIVTHLLNYPGYGAYNSMTTDRDYIAVIFMLSAGVGNVYNWITRSSCSSGTQVVCTCFTHVNAGYGEYDSYLGVNIYKDVLKGSSISNYMTTAYGIYES